MFSHPTGEFATYIERAESKCMDALAASVTSCYRIRHDSLWDSSMNRQ